VTFDKYSCFVQLSMLRITLNNTMKILISNADAHCWEDTFWTDSFSITLFTATFNLHSQIQELLFYHFNNALVQPNMTQQVQSSISLWAFDILALSRGVSPPFSWAKSFIFSLKLSLAPSGGFPALNFFSCCSSSILERGSL